MKTRKKREREFTTRFYSSRGIQTTQILIRYAFSREFHCMTKNQEIEAKQTNIYCYWIKKEKKERIYSNDNSQRTSTDYIMNCDRIYSAVGSFFLSFFVHLLLPSLNSSCLIFDFTIQTVHHSGCDSVVVRNDKLVTNKFLLCCIAGCTNTHNNIPPPT